MPKSTITNAIAEIESEIASLTRALNVLRELEGGARRGPGRPRKIASGDAPGPVVKRQRKKANWTPAMRKAAAERAKQRWKDGKMGPKSKRRAG